MTITDLKRLETGFDAYVRRFADAHGCLHPMQQLKVDHTRRVVGDAGLIMQSQQWDPSMGLLGSACAWLHDIGRFSQYAEFGTFEDHKSIDHAARGCDVALAEGLLDGMPPPARETILTAVRLHNRRDLPSDMKASDAPFVHLVRDADKLDIFRVFEETLRNGGLEKHPEIAWSLDVKGKAAPEILDGIVAGQTMPYACVKSLADFVLIQVGWLRAQFHYDAALALAVERRTLEFYEGFVRTLDDSPAVRRSFAVTRSAIAERLASGLSATSAGRSQICARIAT